MGTQDSVSTRAKTLGIVLIVTVGLLNFHLPHFLLERAGSAGEAANSLELVFLANLLGAAIAAAAIWGHRRWGWLLGVLVAGLSFVLFLAQETVGLPGLPRNWWEPSRIVALIVEALFVVLAWKQVVSKGQRTRA
jgi:hypothetical protein